MIRYLFPDQVFEENAKLQFPKGSAFPAHLVLDRTVTRAKLKRSNDIIIHWEGDGGLVAESTLARGKTRISPEILYTLSCFNHYCFPDQIFERNIKPQFPKMSRAVWNAAILQLRYAGFLISETDKEGEIFMAQKVFGQVLAQHQMLSDRVRTLAYQKAISHEIGRGDVVLDLGSGIGILALFAVAAGAKKVFAIEETVSIDVAKKMAAANKAAQKIMFISCNSKNAELPEKVDVIVSELFGSDPFKEKILEYTIDARNRFLKPGGIMIPAKFEIYAICMQANSLLNVLEKSIRQSRSFHKKYGLNFTPYVRCLESIPTYRRSFDVQLVKPTMLSAPNLMSTLDMSSIEHPAFCTKKIIKMKKGGRCNAVCIFFEATLSKNNVLSTSPLKPKTHWGNLVVYLKKPINVKKNSEVLLETSYNQKSQIELAITEVKA